MFSDCVAAKIQDERQEELMNVRKGKETLSAWPFVYQQQFSSTWRSPACRLKYLRLNLLTHVAYMKNRADGASLCVTGTQNCGDRAFSNSVLFSAVAVQGLFQNRFGAET